MTDRYLRYRLKRELPLTLLVIALVLAVWVIVLLFLKEDTFIIIFDVLMFNIIALGIKPTDEIGFHVNFVYSRKRFYKSQIVMVLIQSLVLALIRATLQYVFYNDYVTLFMEDTDHTIDMYHRVAFPELLLTSMVIFMVFNMIGVLGTVTGIKLLNFGQKLGSPTPQLKLRISNRKLGKDGKFNKVARLILKPVGGLVLLAILLAIEIAAVMFYWFQMLYAFPYRIAIISGIFLAFVILCLVGKYLYKPKYL